MENALNIETFWMKRKTEIWKRKLIRINSNTDEANNRICVEIWKVFDILVHAILNTFLQKDIQETKGYTGP